MAPNVYLAVDLGASSGRLVAGLFDGRRLELAETHRFGNGGILAAGRLHWDLLNLWRHIREGLRSAAGRFGREIASVGVDTWGIDFGLLGRGDELLGNPVHYRDARTNGLMEKTFALVSRQEIFEHTGLQFMQINTLYQLVALRLAGSPSLEAAESLLLMPDLFHWLLSGVKSNEITNATTTQCFDPRRGDWAFDLLHKLGLPTRMLGPTTQPGTKLGPLLAEVAADTGLAGVNVVAPGTHDTASAVMAAPAVGTNPDAPDWCYISSGTWSLMGLELRRPVINDQCLALNFTNEGGVGGTTRLLKNIAGLWLVQECKRTWAQQGRDHSWEELARLAAEAPPLAAVIDPDHSSLLAPADMPAAIRVLCQKSGQPEPPAEGAVIRCALESLALRYRKTLERLERLAGVNVRTIHVLGGGVQNRQLCQMTADACGRRVLAGPVEATASGNILMQAIAAGEVASIAQAREIIAASFPLEEYLPRDADRWQDAAARFDTVLQAG